MDSPIRTRWKGAVTDGVTGFTAVPDILIRSQASLRLSATEMMVILNLLMHWWQGDGQWPYPRLSTIAGRMGVAVRTVERAVVSLESKGLVMRLHGEFSDDGLTVRRFDLSGLVAQLQFAASALRGEMAESETAA